MIGFRVDRPVGDDLLICSKCKKEKHVSRFNKFSTTLKSGEIVWYYKPWCRKCYTSYENDRRNKKPKEPKPKRPIPGRFLFRTYGITSEQYQDMLQKQGGVCAICLKPCSIHSRLCVDHDHETGMIRGLLCSLCNRSLGGLSDSVENLTRAVSYLERTKNQSFIDTAMFVPKKSDREEQSMV